MLYEMVALVKLDILNFDGEVFDHTLTEHSTEHQFQVLMDDLVAASFKTTSFITLCSCSQNLSSNSKSHHQQKQTYNALEMSIYLRIQPCDRCYNRF